jgi:hypothetical protein
MLGHERLTNRLNETVIQSSQGKLPGRVLASFFRFFIRLNRFYNSVYERSKPGWMRKR